MPQHLVANQGPFAAIKGVYLPIAIHGIPSRSMEELISSQLQ